MAEPQYVVFIRVPIPRDGFVDPPPVSVPVARPSSSSPPWSLPADVQQVNWDSKKDEDLWNILSGAAKQEIDCKIAPCSIINEVC